ncbi:helix-turn-helix domain-containing protein [uncultured Piscinibacter sp.]|uniref:helix-turn-helix domain-containing protein n=1 Tax=uncultured Piscinibacter sp. TaxID=1131835 RepID=UPI00260646F4|nr:helix-turn-helix domain-containing protein [uncultured Piscinibacter sp.]
MSETPDDAPVPTATTAGSLLRQARQAQGMHIAMLAAATKVPQRKLEALENDRFDELPDATFTRALAQTVCRTLKVDPGPVLALLPKPPGHRLEQVGEGINAPFRDRAVATQGADWSLIGSPAVWAPLLLLLLAAIVYFLPPGTVSLPTAGPASAPALSATTAGPASAPAADAAVVAPAEPAASVVVETVHAVPAAPDDAASAAMMPAPSVAGALRLRADAESWVEVLDARGQILLSRLLQPGEAVGVDGATPLKLTIGNASATQVTFRGKPVQVTGVNRDNVARMELK